MEEIRGRKKLKGTGAWHLGTKGFGLLFIDPVIFAIITLPDM